MLTVGDRYHVALVDPLPGGLESLNPALPAVAPTVGEKRYQDQDTMEDTIELGWTPSIEGRWWEHQNLRDDRAEAFRTLLKGGTYEFTHFVRATTLGRFTAPAAVAEEMYEPETSGCSNSETVVVE